MAALASELLLLSDLSRFRADNLLSSEDWDAGLYSCLDEDRDVAAELFPCLERSIVDAEGDRCMLGDGFDLDMETLPPDPPWDPLHDNLFQELQVKSEPVSPASSHCSDSSSASSSSSSPDCPGQAPGPAEVIGVKTEHPPTPPCMFGDVLSPPFGTVHISVVPAPDTGRAAAPNKAESILSRKPPIQPKPLVVTTVPVQPANASSKTIVLQPVPAAQPQTIGPGIAVPAQGVVISQSELLHLPVSGLIKVQSPVKEGLPTKPAPSAPKPETKTIVPAPTQIGSCSPEIDLKVLKRQQRMIKNRESACQSRRKKKEYLQGLEARLREALADNERLRRENALLRRRLDGVLHENGDLKFGSGNRKVICVMVVLLFIAFSFGPVSISERKVADVDLPRQEAEAGPSRRHLLTLTEEALEVPEEELPEQQEEAPAKPGKTPFRNLSAPFSDMKDLVLRDLDKLFLASDCRQFNRTESLRLADELSGWVRRHQINGRKPSQSRKATQANQEKNKEKKPLSPSRYVPASPPSHPERSSLSQLQVYQHPDHKEHDFMDAIDRREDTFYVVSFRRDHLLLPAISHNKTSRPKMSLVMPAMALNESLYSSPLGYEVMMQVDCEVMDTRVIHIKSSTVPPFLKRQEAAPDNRTQPSPQAFSGRTTRAALRAHRPSLSSSSRRQQPPRSLYLGEHAGG
ncbi:cyclic AMP-dependent transcription factor ATF-6 beta isoform X2 [Paroedura picta]|uniref:cyclic AMP-dependent transcription factor ATF-6 beta isoform X2 n=1 Tax=Paroedura picta TaxID=143630 RepID=UPI0040576D08